MNSTSDGAVPEPRRGQLRIAMLLTNPCISDTRVIKEAEALVQAGHQVTVFCLAAKNAPAEETRNGVTYSRHAMTRLSELWSRPKAAAARKAASRAPLRVARPALAGADLPQPPLSFARKVLLKTRYSYIEPMRRRLPKPRAVVKRLRLPGRLAVPQAVRPILFQVLHDRLVERTFSAAVRAYRPDVVHAHDLWTLAAGARIARMIGARLVYDTHELALHLTHRPPPIVQAARAWQQRRFIGRADAVITVSDAIAEHLAAQYRVAKPLVLHNAPVVGLGADFGRDIRSDAGLAQGAPLIAYVGGFARYRGVEVLIKALSHYPEAHLVAVGPRSPERDAAVTAQAEGLGVADRVIFLPLVPGHVLTHYLASADVGVIPYQNVALNHEYCMPNKLFECTLAGVPVAVASLKELTRYVRANGVGETMDERDPRSIAATLRRVIENPGLYRPSGERLERLVATYGWHAQAAKLLDLYDRLPVAEPER